MKALVVGAKGQLGKTLVRTAPETISCTPLDIPEIDITRSRDVDALVAAEGPDLIVNAAAYTAVDRAEQEPDPAFAVNADGARHLALAAARHGARLIHVSTDYVFDGAACSPYPPEAPCNPLGVYGRSKHRGEIHVQQSTDDFVTIRTSWLYSRDGGNFVLTLLRLLKERDRIRVVCDQVGAPTWAATLSSAIWAVAAKPALKGIYHWCDAGVASWYDFAVAIQEEALVLGLLDREVSIDPIGTEDFPTAARRPPFSVLDCRRSWRDFGVAPVHWRTGLRRMLGTV